jgi:hypothetical protein
MSTVELRGLSDEGTTTPNCFAICRADVPVSRRSAWDSLAFTRFSPATCSLVRAQYNVKRLRGNNLVLMFPEEGFK